MFLSPLPLWTGEDRRSQCVRNVYPAILSLVEKVHLAGWSREEILVAIADAADSQLYDATGRSMDIVDPCDERQKTRVKVFPVPK